MFVKMLAEKNIAGKCWLVFGCVGTDSEKYIFILQHFLYLPKYKLCRAEGGAADRAGIAATTVPGFMCLNVNKFEKNCDDSES